MLHPRAQSKVQRKALAGSAALCSRVHKCRDALPAGRLGQAHTLLQMGSSE